MITGMKYYSHRVVLSLLLMMLSACQLFEMKRGSNMFKNYNELLGKNNLLSSMQFGALEVSEVFKVQDAHIDVEEYFSYYIPSESFDIELITFLSSKSLQLKYKSGMLPSSVLYEYGFVTFAQNSGGDPIVFDIQTGVVYYFDEQIDEDDVEINVNGEFISEPISRENIIKASLQSYNNFNAFILSEFSIDE